MGRGFGPSLFYHKGDNMPKILEDRKKSIMRGNPDMKEELAYAIATKQLQKEGKLKKKKR